MPFRLPLPTRLTRPRADASLGVVTQRERAQAVVLTRAAGQPLRLVALHSVQAVAPLTALASWQRRAGWRGCKAHLLLDGADYQILPTEAPDVPALELADAMRWKVKEMIDYPAEDAAIGCVLVPGAAEGARNRQAWVVIAPRERVASCMRDARDARLTLTSIDVAELALRNLAALAAGEGACALLHVGVQRSTLVLVWRGELCSVRRFDITVGALLAAGSDDFEGLIERLGSDVQRSADAFERQFHGAALGRLWVTDEQAGLTLVEPLARQLTLQVRALKIAEFMELGSDTPLVDAAAGIDFIPAIGAALRVDETGSTR